MVEETRSGEYQHVFRLFFYLYRRPATVTVSPLALLPSPHPPIGVFLSEIELVVFDYVVDVVRYR